MAFRITEFTSHLKYGGLRPSLYEITVTNPVTSKADSTLPFRAEAATYPESHLGVIGASYFGRIIKLPGHRSFQDWPITIIEDEDLLVRDALETWSTHINSMEGNVNRLPTSEPINYKGTATVKMFSQTGDVLRTIQLIGVWPSSVPYIPLSWSQENIVRYDVTLSYDYWIPIQGQTDIQV